MSSKNVLQSVNMAFKKKNSSSSTEHQLPDKLVSSEELAGTPVKAGLSSNNVAENYFDYLSDEVILLIFFWVPRKCLNKLGLVCHRFNRLIQDESLWTEIDIISKTVSATSFGKIIGHQAIILAAAFSRIEGLSLPRSLSTDFKARLCYVDLSWAKISESTLVALFNQCVRIKKLSLRKVPVSNKVLIALSANKAMESLNLTESKEIAEEGLKHLLTNCTKLRELSMADVTLSAKSVSYLCNNLPASMERLNLSGCDETITDGYVENLVKCCPHLRELDLSQCTALTSKTINYIINLKDLYFLALSPNYSAQESLPLLKQMDSLLYLNIDRAYLQNDGLIKLRRTLGSNVYINRKECRLVAHWDIWNMRAGVWEFVRKKK